ncbi:carbon starvation protein A [Paracoccus nototheniae]|uniref:Carbon starvation protein A n=1 Tax=Paracoccus nototheniae TaxID=2489002 RepID=A0ABW4E160_9RHOB|nr:carbon starvation protein A [Paracoccus nototheniae]
MNSLVLIGFGLVGILAGWFVYSRFIASRIYQLDESFRTPAHEFRDGIDFVPTNRYVLWGHHFTSVAGAAPIVGPAIAVIWGWGPAFLWVVLGTVFFAGVHDMGALWASVRNRGQSIGALSESLLGSRARWMFMLIMFLVLLMVNAAFATVITNLLIQFPTAVIPVWGAIVVAIGIGQVLYRSSAGLMWPTIIGVALLYGLILLGNAVPVALPTEMFGLSDRVVWVLLLFLYAGIASTLPVWMLLQPRDYINGIQLFVALGIIYAAALLSAPTVVVPFINDQVPEGTPPIAPLLFVTIACGAISGFHGLVSSGTSSKQLDLETDGRLVGYGGAVGEGMLALAAIVCATAGFASLAEWQAVYTSFGQGSVGAFVTGGATIVSQGLGIPAGLAATILTVTAALFAGTTMDTGVRLQRYVIQEAGEITGVTALKNGTLATLLAIGFCLAIAFGAASDGTGGMVIWPLFGTSNQLLASLTLLMVTVILARLGRPVIYTLVPLVLVLTMAIYALLLQIGTFLGEANWTLATMALFILGAAILVGISAVTALRSTGFSLLAHRHPAE